MSGKRAGRESASHSLYYYTLLPLRYKKTAEMVEEYEQYPPGIEFPNVKFALMYLFYFVSIFLSFMLMYRFLIILALLFLAYGVAYGAMILRVAKAARLSVLKTRIFTAALFAVAAGAGLLARTIFMW